MVHISYRHGRDSNEEKCVILKEIHFYISDDRTHDIQFVQNFLKLFYDNVIAMDLPFCLHLIWSDGVLDSSTMHIYFNGCVYCT